MKLFLAALLLSAALPAAAQDDDPQETPLATPGRVQAGKVTRATQYAKPKEEEDEAEDDAPGEAQGADAKYHGARMRPRKPSKLDKDAPVNPSGSSGGAGQSGSASGISCEKSVPRLSNVHHLDLPTGNHTTIPYKFGPNEAVSYKFTGPESGVSGQIYTDMGNVGRPVPIMMTISQTPCDFDVAKAKKLSGCHWSNNHNITGGSFYSGKAPKGACQLVAGKTYYMNIRSFVSNPDRDACADEIPFFKKNNLPMECGGIWQIRLQGCKSTGDFTGPRACLLGPAKAPAKKR